jgi:hypothetical protein
MDKQEILDQMYAAKDKADSFIFDEKKSEKDPEYMRNVVRYNQLNDILKGKHK